MTKVPAIPAPTNDNLRDVARAVKGVIDVREGLLGDPLDRFVTLRELNEVSTAVSQAGGSSTSQSGSGGTNSLVLIADDESSYDPEADTTIPPAPEDFSVTGLFASVKLDWGLPLILNYSYTEIWAADTNDLNSAVMIGTSASQMYLDYLGTNRGRYYWIRFVSEANITGPYNDTNGTYGATAPDPELLLESLAGQITETELYQDLGARIDLIDRPGTGLVTQVNTINGKYTVKIDNAGHVTGFGLISTTNNGTPTSAFGIRADQFWIAPPAIYSASEPGNRYRGMVWVDNNNVTRYWSDSGWVSKPTSLPFVVQVAPTVAPNGVVVPPGVYIDTALIKNATITEAQINSVAADTIQAGYTSSVDLESSKFFGSEFYIGGTVSYKYGDVNRPNRKTGILSVRNPSVSITNAGAAFTVDAFSIKTNPTATASPVFEVVGNAARIRQIYTQGLAVTDASGAVILSAGTKLNFTNITPDAGWINANLQPSIDAAAKLGTDANAAANVAQNTANSAVNGLSLKLSKGGDTITGRINFAVTDGLFAGSSTANGCYFGANGLFGVSGGVATFYIDASGNAGFSGRLDVKSASGGQRMEIRNDSIRVFDAGGVVRVKIGFLG